MKLPNPKAKRISVLEGASDRMRWGKGGMTTALKNIQKAISNDRNCLDLKQNFPHFLSAFICVHHCKKDVSS
jgi:hypothetical protein